MTARLVSRKRKIRFIVCKVLKMITEGVESRYSACQLNEPSYKNDSGRVTDEQEYSID